MNCKMMTQEPKTQLQKRIRSGIVPTMVASESGDDDDAIEIMFDCIGGEGRFATLPEFVKAKCRRNIAELEALLRSPAQFRRTVLDFVRANQRKQSLEKRWACH